jgi:Cu/Ag efflux pump CusA
LVLRHGLKVREQAAACWQSRKPKAFQPPVGDRHRYLALGVEEAIREASIGRVRPKVITAATAVLVLLPILLLRLQRTEIERPLAVVMTGGLITSTLFTLLALPRFYLLVHQVRQERAST